MQAAQMKQEKSFISRYVDEDENFWKNHIAEFFKSRLTKTAYCKANQVNYARFFYWIKRLSAQPGKISKTKKQSPPKMRPDRLLPVQLKHESKLNDGILCTLILKNGCMLQIHDQQSLSQILTMWG